MLSGCRLQPEKWSCGQGGKKGVEGPVIVMSRKRGEWNQLDGENAGGQGAVVGTRRKSVYGEQIGLAAASRPAVGVSRVQKDSWSLAGEGLKCQMEIGALGKGDPSKAFEQGWNLASPGFRKTSRGRRVWL